MQKKRILIANACAETTRVATLLKKHGWEVQTENHPDRLAQVCRQFKPAVGLFRLDDTLTGHHLAPPLRAALAETQIDWIAAVPRRLIDLPAWQTLLYEWVYDYHTLPYDPERLLVTLGRAYGRALLNQNGGEQVEPQTLEYADFIGQCANMRKLKDDIRKVASTGISAMITGESGTGKEMVARLLHEMSPRKGGPFVAVNCAAIPGTLIQSELFGYERGAFTGANPRKIGRIAAAATGPLFVAEIGDLARDLQANLLRFLQEGTIERVGSAVSKEVDVRVISATHVNLPLAIAAGNFRDDLFYRLNVCNLRIPPLRERQEDIIPLAERFLTGCVARQKLPPKRFASEALTAMQRYTWPGNVRELQNRVYQGAVMSAGRQVTPLDMGIDDKIVPEIAWQTLDEVRGLAERGALQRTLTLCRYNYSLAAQNLGISRATLYRLLDKHQLGTGDDPDDEADIDADKGASVPG